MTIEVRGEREVRQMLGDYMNPKLSTRLQSATKAGAEVFKKPVQAEAGKVSKRLRRSVSVKRARKERPATIVYFRAKIAWFRHFIIGGTRDHGPRTAPFLVFESRGEVVRAKRVKGVRPNPIMSRVADRYERQAYDAIDRSLDSTET